MPGPPGEREQIMSAENSTKRLREEAFCYICFDDLADPVTLSCGHNFCHSCVAKSWDGTDTDVSCPQCMKTSQLRNLRPNRQLANMIEATKKFCQSSWKQKGENLCETHEEELTLFCEEDQKLICHVCYRSRDHTSHTMIPIPKAVQQYKNKFEKSLEPLRRELDDLLRYKCDEEKKAADLENEAEIKRQKIVSEFEELHQFLNTEKQNLLSRLENKRKKILQRISDNVNQLKEKCNSLLQLISEIEKSHQSATELLKDVKETLSRCEKVKLPQPKVVSTNLKMGFEMNYLQQLKKVIIQFGGLEWRMRYGRYAANVTLDPETAHPLLIISEDRKNVRRADTRQDVTDNPQRFDSHACVLGSKGFSSGRHYWEVDVGNENTWVLGVCKESVNRKGEIDLSPGKGYWIVWLHEGIYQALTRPRTMLPMIVKPRAVGIFLDYEAGKVSFYNADKKSHLFTFTDTFTDILLPFFRPYYGALGICRVPASD